MSYDSKRRNDNQQSSGEDREGWLQRPGQTYSATLVSIGPTEVGAPARRRDQWIQWLRRDAARR